MKDLKLLCVGDAFIARIIGMYKDEPDIAPLFKRISKADVSFVNLENVIHNFEGYPIGEGKSDAYGQADPIVADDLKNLGFDICSQANNHAMDYSVGGLRATISHLDRVGLVHAGAGMNLAEAREPAFFDTPQGVVSLVSACTYNLGVSSHNRKDIPGRPGINPLRLTPLFHLSKDHWVQLRGIAKALDFKVDEDEKTPKDLRFPDRNTRFKLSDKTTREYVFNKNDLEGNLKAVRDARRLSDFVLFSLHDHYSGIHAPKGFRNLELPPAEIREFAHRVIDVGADAYIGHGPHIMRGVEIYNGKPIFYSLGNFVFQSTLIRRQPSDLFDQWDLGTDHSTPDLYEKREAPPAIFFNDPAYWESVVVEIDYKSGKIVELRLIPIVLDYDSNKPLSEQRTKAGVPRQASGNKSRKIINEIKRLSAFYGTKIIDKDGIGYIDM